MRPALGGPTATTRTPHRDHQRHLPTSPAPPKPLWGASRVAVHAGGVAGQQAVGGGGVQGARGHRPRRSRLHAVQHVVGAMVDVGQHLQGVGGGGGGGWTGSSR